MKNITIKNVFKQIKADLIGKDSYRGVALTYSWLANQFGHFSLGYIPCLLLYAILKKYASIDNPSFFAALIISMLWLMFETYNFLGPLLFKKPSQSKLLYVPSGKNYVFRPAWVNVAFDTFTDLCFFWLGAFLASLFLHFSWTIIIILAVLSVILIYPVGYWFVTKMYIQYARLPMQFRLSQWEGNFNNDDEKIILKFLDLKDTSLGNHLLVFGGRRSGKSPLSVGIGTEFSIKRFSCSYYTVTKLLNLFSLTDEEIVQSEQCDIWSWRMASLLIIDDINPGNPISEVFLSPEEIMKSINIPVRGDATKNKSDLKNKNVIWVLGDGAHVNAMSWQKMILDIGIPEEKMFEVRLGFHT